MASEEHDSSSENEFQLSPEELDALIQGDIPEPIPEEYAGDTGGEASQPSEDSASTDSSQDADAYDDDGLDSSSSGLDAPLTNEDIDAIISGFSDDEQTLEATQGADSTDSQPGHVSPDPDAEGAGGSTDDQPAEGIANADIDSLLGISPEIDAGTQEISEENYAAASAPPPDAEKQDPALSEDILESLIEQAQEVQSGLSDSEAQDEEDTAEATKTISEPRAAQVPAQGEGAAQASETIEPGNVSARASRGRGLWDWITNLSVPIPDLKYARAGIGALASFVRRNALRISASVSAGLVAGTGAFTFLYTHQTRMPSPETVQQVAQPGPNEALRMAREFLNTGQFNEARDMVAPILARPPSEAMARDARFVDIEARYRAFANYATGDEISRFHADVDEFARQDSADPRSAEALYWQGRLYQATGLPYEARRNYRQILDQFDWLPFLDDVLYQSARVALEAGQPAGAIKLARQMLERFPGSPSAGEAKLLLGDAYWASGDAARAKDLFEDMRRTQAHSALGAKAALRLARMAFNRGDHDEAIRLLEQRRQRATTIEGNDEVYLLLAKAYQETERMEDAERVLRELIDFFPESQVTSEAYVELSHVLDQRGDRREALRLARTVAEAFGSEPEVLERTAAQFKQAGDMLSAADAYHKAYTSAGGQKPALLLEAGRAYAKAGDRERAEEVFDNLQQIHPESREAFQAGIELAKLEQNQGKLEPALARLQALRERSQDDAQRLDVLRALGQAYMDAGLPEPAAEAYEEVAGLTNDPALLAEAAIALLGGGKPDVGMAAARRVDLQTLDAEHAYELLMAHGTALLRSDPETGVAKMDEAASKYPSQRTGADDRKRVRAYLTLGQPVRARQIVAEMERRAAENPAQAQSYLETAAEVADHLYEQGDYRAALSMYDKVLNHPSASGEAQDWARFQQATIHYRLDEREQSLEAFQRIAQSDSAWQQDAAAFADYLDMERRIERPLGTGSPTPG